MISITALPQHIVGNIFDYLPEQTLKSVSLAHPSWTRAYQERSCRTLSLELSSDSFLSKLALLQRWEHLELLHCVRRITLNDSGERSKDGKQLLQEVFDHWMPKLSGLESVAWGLSSKAELEDASILTKIPGGVLLDLTYEDDTSQQVAANIISSIQSYDGLRSLAVELSLADVNNLGQEVKTTILSCKGLRTLKINVITSSGCGGLQQANFQDDGGVSNLTWTAEEAANMPALRHLDLCYPSLTAEAFEAWARHGDWRFLQTLTAHHGWTLEHLSGRLPALKRLSVRTVEHLSQFLAAQPQIQGLAITNLETSATPVNVASAFSEIFKMPVASNLEELDLRTAQSDDVLEQSTVDVGAIAASCPKLRRLTVAVTSQQYRNAVGYFCWMDACIESVVRMPSLLRLCIILPRVIPSGSISIQPEIVILPAVVDLWAKLGAHGQKLQELRLIAAMDSEKPETDREKAVLRFVSTKSKALTFVVTPAEKDWDAEQGAYKTSCPELEEAERLLLRGQLSRLSQTEEYSMARRAVDDISTFVHRGTIVPKKKPRPMPVWLTPEEEQDRREGPPSQGRRAKRALIRSVSEFAGVWRLPMTETSPRTAEERAQSRENGFGGRPGWSKSSLAMRVFYRR